MGFEIRQDTLEQKYFMLMVKYQTFFQSEITASLVLDLGLTIPRDNFVMKILKFMRMSRSIKPSTSIWDDNHLLWLICKKDKPPKREGKEPIRQHQKWSTHLSVALPYINETVSQLVISKACNNNQATC